MQCPYCASRTQVTNSRSHNHAQAVWRRRQCRSCSAIWTTDERYELSKTHRVSKPSQKRPQPFERDVLYISIWKALQHRNTATNDATGLTDTIIARILTQKTPTFKTTDIKTAAYTALSNFDQTAAAVYNAQN